MATPFVTDHLETIYIGDLLCFWASYRIKGSEKYSSFLSQIQETAISFFRQNKIKFSCVLYGWNSIWTTAGLILAYESTSLNIYISTLHKPIFLTRPSSTSFSIAYHVSYIGTGSSIICLSCSLNTQPGGYLSSIGTYFKDILG